MNRNEIIARFILGSNELTDEEARDYAHGTFDDYVESMEREAEANEWVALAEGAVRA